MADTRARRRCIVRCRCVRWRTCPRQRRAGARRCTRDALAQEQAVRTALARPTQTPAVVLKAVRDASSATTRRSCAHYPASGYSDNALWQAGRLALDAFARFGQRADRDAGVASAPRARCRVSDEQARRSRCRETCARTPPQPREPRESPRRASPVSAGREQTAPTSQRHRRARPIATIKASAAQCCPTPCASRSSSTPRCRSTTSASPIPTRVFVDLPSTRAAPALVDQHAALRRRRRRRAPDPRRPPSEQHDARRARRGRRVAATASTRSTARIVW